MTTLKYYFCAYLGFQKLFYNIIIKQILIVGLPTQLYTFPNSKMALTFIYKHQ